VFGVILAIDPGSRVRPGARWSTRARQEPPPRLGFTLTCGAGRCPDVETDQSPGCCSASGPKFRCRRCWRYWVARSCSATSRWSGSAVLQCWSSS